MEKTKIITKLILKAEKEICEKLKIIEKDIEDFSSPMNLSKNAEKKHEILEERMSGRLSSENLRKNYEKKLKLERELRDINFFKYRQEEEFS